MVDPILKDLLKFLDEEYISRSLKIKFTDGYYKSYGISTPQNAELLTEYHININDTNPYNGKTIKYKQYFNLSNYIENKINDNFVNLISDYLRVVSFESDEVKKSAYYSTIYKQLHQFYSEVKKCPFLKPYKEHFKNGINAFKNQFGHTTIQRATFIRNLEHSYIIEPSQRISYDLAEYKLSGVFKKLKIHGFIDIRIAEKDFLKLFSGKEIDNRIQWTNTLSSFYYFIKKLNKLDFIKNLGNNKWHVADKCFYVLNKDGEPFLKHKFRSQKNPSQNIMTILDDILSV